MIWFYSKSRHYESDSTQSTVTGGETAIMEEKESWKDLVLETLIFADGIKMIPGYFCYKGGMEGITTHWQDIEIPESVTEIGEKAFDGCARLEEIEIGKEINRVETVHFKAVQD